MIVVKVIVLTLLIISIIILSYLLIVLKTHKSSEANKDETVGRIIINMSDPDKEYFECELYSNEFFKNVHQKPTVTFDVEIR